MGAWRNGQVETVSLDAVLAQSPLYVTNNSYLLETAHALGIYVRNGANKYSGEK
jgi:ATP-dependent phosphofructokinase / diphosphate-dependent phosphofructokinase